MLHLAQEELGHFERIVYILRERDWPMLRDEADPYVKLLLGVANQNGTGHLVDRLLVLSLVEARSCERFHLLAQNLQDETLKSLYLELALSEEGHANLFVQLAEHYVQKGEVSARLERYRDQEAEIVRSLPGEARIHG
jgi:tRNA-(ms[2]io[6]A)-hydroxylase